MLFTSLIFLFVYLPLVIAGYFLTPKILKSVFLLLASLFFYAWGDSVHVVLFLFIIILNYAAALCIQRYKRFAKHVFFSTIFVNLAILLYYKYFVFVIGILIGVFPSVHIPSLKAPAGLPLGLSFIIFRVLSYSIDVYKNKTKAEYNPVSFALYVTLFPILIAGPIVRYLDINEQLKSRRVTLDLFSTGITRFIFGLGKKVIIANTLGTVTDSIFQLQPFDLRTELVWLAMISYMFQIYFDFSGYSDMAIGLGRMFGFTFKENFNYPYISRSIKEFWSRWHISLSSWFRDYVYIPLGGNRLGAFRTYLNILVVFLLTGFWHGAGFNFIVWGLYFGIVLFLEKMLERYIKRLWVPVQHFYALSVVFFGWVLFRVESLAQAGTVFKTMFDFSSPINVSLIQPFITNEYVFVFTLALCMSAPTVSVIDTIMWKVKKRMFRKRQSSFMWTYNTILLVFTFSVFLYSIMKLVSKTYTPFIYFKF